MFLYPYLALGGQITVLSLFFFILFTLYMMFFEIAHQFEHQDQDRIKSIIDVFGRETSYNLARWLLIIALTVAGASMLVGGQKMVFFTAAIFNLYRLQSTFKHDWRYLEEMRNGNDKFYILQESIIYTVLLIPLVVG